MEDMVTSILIVIIVLVVEIGVGTLYQRVMGKNGNEKKEGEENKNKNEKPRNIWVKIVWKNGEATEWVPMRNVAIEVVEEFVDKHRDVIKAVMWKNFKEER